RPPRRAVEDADADEREVPRGIRTTWPRLPVDSCRLGHSRERAGPDATDAIRHAWLAEASRRRLDEHVASHELLEGWNRLAVQHRAGGDTPGGSFVEHLLRRPRTREGVHGGRELLPPLEAHVRAGKILVVEQVGAPDH